MAALSPPRVFRRLADRGAFFRGLPFRWVLHLALSLTRSVIVHVATSYSREDPQSECSRPCDNLSLASAEPIYIGAGDSGSQGYRPDLLQNVTDQGHHMLTSGV